MERAFYTGVLLGFLTFAGLNLYIFLQLLTDWGLVFTACSAAALAIITGAAYMWFGRGCYGKSFLFWVVFTILFNQFFSVSPNDMYLFITDGEYGLGGGGGFGLMIEFLMFFAVYSPALAIVCPLFGALFHKILNNKP